MAPIECQKNVDFVLQDLRTTPTKDGQISSLVNKAIEDWMVIKLNKLNNRRHKSSWNLFLCFTEELGLKFFY